MTSLTAEHHLIELLPLLSLQSLFYDSEFCTNQLYMDKYIVLNFLETRRVYVWSIVI